MRTSITPSEFQNILNNSISRQYYLIYKILFYSNISPDDLFSLTCDRIYEKNGRGFIITENFRHIPINNELFTEIKDFLAKKGRAWGNKSDITVIINRQKIINYLFEGKKIGDRINQNTVRNRFREDLKGSDINRNITINDLSVLNFGKGFILLDQQSDKLETEKNNVLIVNFNSLSHLTKIKSYLIGQNYLLLKEYFNDEEKSLIQIKYNRIVIKIHNIDNSENYSLNELKNIFLKSKFLGVLLYGNLSNESDLVIINDIISNFFQNTGKQCVIYLIIDGLAIFNIELMQDLVKTYTHDKIFFKILKDPEFVNNTIEECMIEFTELMIN